MATKPTENALAAREALSRLVTDSDAYVPTYVLAVLISVSHETVTVPIIARTHEEI